ncbi:hypothetical protein Adt_20880 [Abeliophyllum distichum]|uniref:Uncharacterized protein n=1 Tax=Abeliophyllum distichum TaxID=126358 RepID=A0ABD1SXV0_9LAMI
MATTIVHSTNARGHDISKGKGIFKVPDNYQNLGMRVDVKPSMLTIKAQHAASVTPVLQRSPRLKIFQNGAASSSHTTHPNNAQHSLSRAYQGGDLDANDDGHSCFQNIKSYQSNVH